ncbi:MAG: NapC/NirT family cytochrome c [bacterium]|nr:NapC/NirT family cytochrome c [bacterium]
MKLFKEFLSALKVVFLLPFTLTKIGFQRFFSLGARQIILLILAGVILTVITAVVFVKATSQPAFCRSCHIMEPYFASWETSSHKHVDCITCHIPPGLKGKIEGKFVAASMLVNYATGVYKRSKPWAEIEDQNCTTSDCHESRLLVGPLEWKQGIKFNHESHLSHEVRNKQLRCTSCHGQIVQGAHITVTESTCFLCHFKDVPSSVAFASSNDSPSHLNNRNVFQKGSTVHCTQCHSAPVKEVGKPEPKFDHTEWIKKQVECQMCHGPMKVGNGEVPHERCNICHASRDHIDRIHEIEFMHQKHVTERKVDCQNCHTTIQHISLSKAQTTITDCNRCHSDLHSATEMLFRGTGGVEVAEQPDIMWKAGLNCESCHSHPTNQDHFLLNKPVKANCLPCHDPSYQKLTTQWKTSFQIKLQNVQEALQVAKNNRTVSQDAIQRATINYQLVRQAGGWHNPKYANALLEKSLELLTGQKEALTKKSTPALPHNLKCYDCHTGIDAIGVLVGQKTFPHSIHLSKGIQCSDCHSTTQHGVTLTKGNNCIECHHANAKDETSCKHCHTYQKAMYLGTANDGKPLPSLMAEAGVECTACHGTGLEIIRPTTEQCGDCHDASYIKMGKEWQQMTRVLLDSVEKMNLSTLSMKTRKNYLSVKNDGSNGAHNPELTEKLLKSILIR